MSVDNDIGLHVGIDELDEIDEQLDNDELDELVLLIKTNVLDVH